MPKGYVLGAVDGYPVYLFGYGRGTFPAIGGGVGADYALTKRLRVRAELGDLAVHYTQVTPVGTITGPQNFERTKWDSAITAKVGVYVGVGHALAEPGPEIGPEAGKGRGRFLDRTNLALIAASVGAQTADGVTTQRFIRRGIVEQNAFARPLVNEG